MATLGDIDGYEFENFVLQKRAHSLTRAGTEIPLTPKEFQTLLVLIESAGTAVEKEALLRAVWPDTFVTDSSLTRNISILRKHLGDNAIHTIPKYGYRFAYPVYPLVAEPTTSSLTSVEADPVPDTLPLPAPLMVTPQSRKNHRRIYWIAAASLALIGLISASVHLAAARPEAPPPVALTAPTRLAVLPFRNLSSEPSTGYLASGLAEDLVTTLSQGDTGRIRVVAATSSRLYAGTDKAAAQIARELNAQYLVDGTIQTQGQQLILTVHLIDGHDQTMLWSGKFPRPLVQPQQLQTDINESIAREIQVRIVSGKGAYTYAGQTPDPLAHDAYLHGRFELEQKNVPAFRRALDQFGAAVDLDPRYARAYAGIAEAYLDLAGHIPNRPAYAQAKADALHAIQLDSQLAEAHRDLAWVYFAGEANANGAEDEFRRALALNPSDARAHHWYAQLLVAEHKTGAALAEAKEAFALDPLSLGSTFNYALILIYAGQPEEGIRHLDAVRERDPNNEIVYNYLGRAYSATHQYARAADCFQRATEISHPESHEKAEWAYALAMAGDSSQARRLVDELETSWKTGAWLPAAAMTKAYIGLGDKDRAFTWLTRCVAERSCTLLDVNTEPFTGLSADPRFAQLTAPLYGQLGPALQAAVRSK